MKIDRNRRRRDECRISSLGEAVQHSAQFSLNLAFVVNQLPLWFLVFALFLPRLAMVVAWFQGVLPSICRESFRRSFGCFYPGFWCCIDLCGPGVDPVVSAPPGGSDPGLGQRRSPDAKQEPARVLARAARDGRCSDGALSLEDMERRRVGILGATGMVGQRFIQLLNNHPWFEIAWLAASDRSAGKTYAEACRWKLDSPFPARIASMTLQPNVPEGSAIELPKIIFAALDADIARELEPKFAAAGCAVISNSSAFRMVADVPLVVPEVNADHLALIETRSGAKRAADIS